jgi:asparagine synthase (glutamine-hydrolysing)
MCRIAGLVTNQLSKDKLIGTVTAMCNALQHGGPDDEGVFCSADGRIAFGHRRLSIIDLSVKGHQPMADAAQKAWITFNGEIYNYLELKAELQKLGAVFNTSTDTEVIIQAYIHWGTKSFSKLRGMFAFALYDLQSRAVYLVRDTMGIKPLYYNAAGGQLYFASEIKAFKTIGVNTTDTRWPIWLLAYGHIPEPYTTLKNVLSLPKGHFLRMDSNGAFTVNNYQPTEAAKVYINETSTAQAGLKDHLQTAIRRQLMSDAPIGVFLSGGIDSSLLALLAEKEKSQLKTISIYFDEKKYDERSYQNAVLSKLSGENFVHLVTQQDFEEHLPDILNAMDMPTTDGINSWFISKYAHDNGLKAVLSGLGADELFGGYPSFQRIEYLRYLKMVPGALYSFAKLFNEARYKKLAYLAHNNSIADFLFLRGIFAPADIAKILDLDESEVNRTLFETIKTPSLGSYNKLQAAWLETNLYMQNQLLHDTDIMSMNHGLEVRVPYLDEDLQQYISQINPAIRFGNNQPKKLLIDTFKDTLPEVVWNRPKMGFTFPLQQWMKANKVIGNENHYRGKVAKQIIKNFNKGKTHWSRLFALYQVQGHV